MTQNKDSASAALCYDRKSQVRKGAVPPASPDMQWSANRRRAEEMGLEPRRYSDADGHRSGKTAKRPGWQALLAELRGTPDVRAVVVYNWSRAFRNARLALEFADECAARSITFISTQHNMDITSPAGRMVFTMLAAVDEHESNEAGVRRAENIDALRRERGRHFGFPPFGTERVAASGDRVLVPSTKAQTNGTDHGALVCLYETWNAQRLSIRKLTRAMNAAGWQFRDKYGALREWRMDDVRRALTLHWVYSGYVVVGRSHHGPSEILRGSHAPIIPDALTAPVAQWLAATRKLGRRNRQPYSYILSGVLHCGCGARLVGTVIRGVRYYQHRMGCELGHLGTYNAERIERLARERVAGLRWPLDMRHAHHADVTRYLAAQSGGAESERRRYAELLARLDHLFVEGKISEPRYDELRAEYLAQAPAMVEPPPAMLAPLEALPRLPNSLSDATPELLREVVRGLYTRIVVRGWDAIEWQARPEVDSWA